jgi:hypothetical protein
MNGSLEWEEDGRLDRATPCWLVAQQLYQAFRSQLLQRGGLVGVEARARQIVGIGVERWKRIRSPPQELGIPSSRCARSTLPRVLSTITARENSEDRIESLTTATILRLGRLRFWPNWRLKSTEGVGIVRGWR